MPDRSPSPSLRQGEAEVAQLLALSLNGASHAIDIHQIREIVKNPELARLPTASGALAGITSLRGALIEVYDLAAAAVGDQVDPTRAVLLISDTQERTRGFLVDDVHSILRVSSSDIHPAHRFKSFDSPLLSGFLLEANGSVLSILDLAAFGAQIEEKSEAADRPERLCLPPAIAPALLP